MLTSDDSRTLAQIALVVLLIIGCIAVLLPFVGALLFALVVWLCTWEAYRDHILPRLGGKPILGAALMVLALMLVFLVPTIFLAGALVRSSDVLVNHVRPLLTQGLPADPPAWFASVPLFGDMLDNFWHEIAGSREAFNALLGRGIGPVREFLLRAGGVAANGLLQLALVFFVAFFLYRDGQILANILYQSARKLGGDLGEHLVNKTRDTVFGVMLGIIGTAMAQATVAVIGFFIAGAPAPLLLAFATFFLSMVPVGPPLIWVGAAFWLYSEGQIGWAIFMALYGLLVISSIDNLVKPILIARGAGLSLLVIGLGVFGGVLVFGFIGIFLGPVLLALGQMLLLRWLNKKDVA